MIEFPCHCGHRFSLEDDMAGSFAQCPRCGRLNDVPTAEDLARMAPDGTYQLEEAEPQPPRLEQLRHYFGQRMSHSAELDLRNEPESIARAGEHDDPLQISPAHLYPRPKYDPETGQLIRPIDIKPDPEQPDPGSIPVARPAPLSYAAGDLHDAPGVGRIAVRILMSGSVITLFFVFLVHGMATAFVMIGGLSMFMVYLATAAAVFMMMLIIAHYGCVVEETGPMERDELPRMLRNFEFHEDIWQPFTGFTGALMLAYLPAVLALMLLPAPPEMLLPLAGALAVLGTFFFPALLLTTLTSGTALNLRPDRVMGVVRGCGAGYLGVVIVWVLSAIVYGGVLAMIALPTPALLAGVPWMVVWPALAVAIYLMHLFCWMTGRLYRINYGHFPWILQRYIPARRPAGAPPA